jgi:hypothetical protein
MDIAETPCMPENSEKEMNVESAFVLEQPEDETPEPETELDPLTDPIRSFRFRITQSRTGSGKSEASRLGNRKYHLTRNKGAR